jgi:Phage integrase, N-terminal SAM-like domain
MATTSPSAALIAVTPVFTTAERLALAGFLAGYSGLTREAYELDLRQYVSWCQTHHLQLFTARRPDIECFARDLEARGRARATITRRLSTIAGFYGTPSRKSFSITRPPFTCAGHDWTMSHTPPPWIETRWVPCSSRPGSVRPPSTS